MLKIELMKSSPTIEDGVQVFAVTGASRDLFRLLVLYGDKVVNRAAIASLRDTYIDSAPSKVRDLRGALGPHGNRIVNERGIGYRFDLSDCDVDALNFKQKANEVLRRKFQWDIGLMSCHAAEEEIRHLSQALKLWVQNPASDLPSTEHFEIKFERLFDELTRRLTFARLHMRSHELILGAIADLEASVRRREADALYWNMLLLAYDGLGIKAKFFATWNRISEEYDPDIPDVLMETYAAINSSGFRNPFTIVGATNTEIQTEHKTPNDEHANSEESVSALCELIGITTASQLHLQDSKLTPLSCMKTARRRLWFSGVLASKWVSEAAVRSKFDAMLERFNVERGEARFMIINPKSEAYTRLHKLREGNISRDSVELLKRLAEKHSSLQVRTFDKLPSFRVVIIDEDVVSFSPYRLAADPYLRTKRGWKAPHIVLDPMANYPLAEAFTLLFEESWNSGTPIKELS